VVYAFGNIERVFGENSDVANAIRKSDEYKKVIGSAIEKQMPGYMFHNAASGVNFQKGDLATSVGKGKLSYNGEVCKQENGGASVNLRVTLSDRYDFDFWWIKKWNLSSIVVTIGNDLAWYDQMRGVINPFHWRVTFDEKRSWPW